jgi:hypothetical protein
MIRVIYQSKEIRFEMTSKEQIRILCCKKKRKDELIKFSFKFIRRHIYLDFRKKYFENDPNVSKKKVKEKFHDIYLNNDKKSIKYFESFDVSRKGLLTLKNFHELKKKIRDFQRSKYLQLLIKEYIFEQSDEILTDDLTFQEFIDDSLSRQHKHIMVIQGVINSLELFIDYFTI